MSLSEEYNFYLNYNKLEHDFYLLNVCHLHVLTTLLYGIKMKLIFMWTKKKKHISIKKLNCIFIPDVIDFPFLISFLLILEIVYGCDGAHHLCRWIAHDTFFFIVEIKSININNRNEIIWIIYLFLIFIAWGMSLFVYTSELIMKIKLFRFLFWDFNIIKCIN